MKISLGADPEFFLDYNGMPALAHFFVPGTKARPHKTPHGWVQADGCAVEFNIEPATNRLQFARNIQKALADIRAFVPKNIKFDYYPTVIFGQDLWPAIPEEAKEMGCDPDYSADRNGQLNAPPDFHYASVLNTMRNGGGHLHIGWKSGLDYTDKSDKFDCIALVNALLGSLGNYAELWDMDTARRFAYGSGGAFRPKSFGVEYRSLSNAWLNHPNLWPWMYDVVEYTFNSMLEKGSSPRYTIGYLSYAVSRIREGMTRKLTPESIEEAIYKLNSHFQHNHSADWPAMPPGTLNYEAIIQARERSKKIQAII